MGRMTIWAVVLVIGCGVGAFMTACGGGGGGGGGGAGPLELGPVMPYYGIHSPYWNYYVKNDGPSIYTASDTAATGNETGGYTAVIHGGEMRMVTVTGLSACDGVTASDALGAFQWTCYDGADPVKVVSEGLAEGKSLSDLIDFDAVGWKENSVTVMKDGETYGSTPAAAWWDNPVVTANDGGPLWADGCIYIVNAPSGASQSYTIGADRVGLVVEPGKTLTGPGNGGSVIYASGKKFLFLEGELTATGDEYGVNWNDVRFSVMRGVRAEGATDIGVRLESSSGNTLANLTAAQNKYGVILAGSSNNTLTSLAAVGNYGGVVLYGADNNRLSRVTATSNGYVGVHLIYLSTANTLSGVTAAGNQYYGVFLEQGSSNNALSDLAASYNGDCGVLLSDSSSNTLASLTAANNKTGVNLYSSSNNTLSDVTVANNDNGAYLDSSSGNRLFRLTASNNRESGVLLMQSRNNTLSDLTAANNKFGVFLHSSSRNTLSDLTAANNSNMGVYLYSSSQNSLSNVIGANNEYYGVLLEVSSNNKVSNLAAGENGLSGVDLYLSSNNYFTGLVKVGNNASGDCSVDGGTNPGLQDNTCLNNGSSDATLTTGVSLAGSFAAKVTEDDPVNLCDSNGCALYSSVTDWTSFENPYRGWGRDGSAFASTTNRGYAGVAQTCRIWDWSLRTGDGGDAGSPAVLDVLDAPGPADTLSHTWSDSTRTEFLRNTVEISGDGIGNDNTLCEAGEDCVHTRNMGSYQGHGGLAYYGSVSMVGGNVDLYVHSVNGY